MNSYPRVRKIVREVFLNENANESYIGQWDDFYHNLSNIAHHNLIAINIILNNSELSHKEKNCEISNQYEIYLDKIRSLKLPI